MKKRTGGWLVMLVMVLVGAMQAMAADVWLKPLTVQEMGYRGATHVVDIGAPEMTVSDANVAQTNTVTLTGPMAWQFVGFELSAPFDSASVTNAHSILYSATLGSQALVSAVQVAADTWKPYKSIFPVENTLTNVYAGVITNGASATLTAVIGAPGASCTLNRLSTGRARLFFRCWP